MAKRVALPLPCRLDIRAYGGQTETVDEGPEDRQKTALLGCRARYTWNMLQTKEILDDALQLPDKEREQLVDELSASLHSGFSSAEIEQSWASEIERRSSEIETGKAVLRDWDEVRDEILTDLRDRP